MAGERGFWELGRRWSVVRPGIAVAIVFLGWSRCPTDIALRMLENAWSITHAHKGRGLRLKGN